MSKVFFLHIADKPVPEHIFGELSKSKMFSEIKSFAKYLIIPTGAIMFFPDSWLEQLMLLEIKNNFGQWIGIV